MNPCTSCIRVHNVLQVFSSFDLKPNVNFKSRYIIAISWWRHQRLTHSQLRGSDGSLEQCKSRAEGTRGSIVQDLQKNYSPWHVVCCHRLLRWSVVRGRTMRGAPALARRCAEGVCVCVWASSARVRVESGGADGRARRSSQGSNTVLVLIWVLVIKERQGEGFHWDQNGIVPLWPRGCWIIWTTILT